MVTCPRVNAAAFLSLERSRRKNDKRQPKLSTTSGIIWFLVYYTKSRWKRLEIGEWSSQKNAEI